jgi:hypothetical protein
LRRNRTLDFHRLTVRIEPEAVSLLRPIGGLARAAGKDDLN